MSFFFLAHPVYTLISFGLITTGEVYIQLHAVQRKYLLCIYYIVGYALFRCAVYVFLFVFYFITIYCNLFWWRDHC